MRPSWRTNRCIFNDAQLRPWIPAAFNEKPDSVRRVCPSAPERVAILVRQQLPWAVGRRGAALYAPDVRFAHVPTAFASDSNCLQCGHGSQNVSMVATQEPSLSSTNGSLQTHRGRPRTMKCAQQTQAPASSALMPSPRMQQTPAIGRPGDGHREGLPRGIPSRRAGCRMRSACTSGAESSAAAGFARGRASALAPRST